MRPANQPRHGSGLLRLSQSVCCSVIAAAVSACAAPAEEPESDAVVEQDTGGLFGDTAGIDAVSSDASQTDQDGEGDTTKPKDFDSGPGLMGGTLLSGMLVTPLEAFAGQLLVQGDLITCVQPGKGCQAKADAAGAKSIDTQGIIAPGLIDMHNHILFDIFDDDDWVPSKTYFNHNEWPKEPRYGAMLDVKQCLENASQGKPTWCSADKLAYATKDGNVKCEMNKWGELKGIVAGTTSIVGLPGVAQACFHSLARSIGTPHNDLADDRIQTSALFPPSTSSADGVCKNYTSGTTEAYLIHCGEGIDDIAKNEFKTLLSVTTEDGCLLHPGTVLTHATAFGKEEFATMKANGVKLTWSVASNVALYGATTDIPAALDAGVLVSIGPDWSMGGSQNMLDELRYADAWDNKYWGNRLSPQDLLLMATLNGAYSLGLQGEIGQLKVGLKADLFVYEGDQAKPFDALLKATPAEVKLVMVNGVALYGDAALQGLAGDNPGCEKLALCGRSKFACVAENSSADKLGQTLSDIQTVLEKALVDVDAATPQDGWNFAPLTPLVKCGKP